MEGTVLIEFFIGSIGVILGLFFSIFLWVDRKNQPQSNLFLIIYLIAFSLRVGKSLFHYKYMLPATFRTYLICTLFCIGPAIFLFSKKYKSDGPEIDRKEALHFAPFLLLLFSAWIIPNDGTSPIFAWFYNTTILHMLFYMVWSIFISYRRKDIPIRENKWFYCFLYANILFVLIYFLISELIIPYNGISILFSSMIMVCGICALNEPSLFRLPIKKYHKSNVSQASAIALWTQVDNFLKENKSFLNPDLTLTSLADQIVQPSKAISQAINQVKGQNFSQYITGYRIEEAQRRLSDPNHHHLTIASIAYDSGFNSLSAFNTNFKKLTGQTPKQFRDSA